MFFMISSKQTWIYDTEYDALGNSNFSFHVRADTLIISKFIVSERLSNSLWGSDVLLIINYPFCVISLLNQLYSYILF